ncbi:MAG: hypothetical protein R3B68_10455 [Phycisphaerales bacterium]
MAVQGLSGMLGRNDASGETRAHVAVFGKHPGWDDHIDDIGLTTERLVQIKRILYVEGIGGNIDAGAWDAMPEEARIAGFEHAFVWRAGGELAVGRFWSSTDGKGRQRYPMVVCAQVRGQPMSWQLRYVLPVLERLEDEFKQAKTAERVRALAENAQKELEALAGDEVAPPDRHAASASATLAGGEAMGPERRGMYRLLYQMERELSSFLRGELRDTSRSRVADLTPRHLRVPRVERGESESLALWWRFVCENVGDAAPLVLLSPRGQGWIDILVGEPSVSLFTCVRAGEQSVPLATDIPYTFDEAFTRRADERIAAASADAGAEAPTKRIAPIGTGGGRSSENGAGGGGLEPRQIAMIAGAAVLGIVVIGGAIALMSGGGGGTSGENPSPPPPPSTGNPTGSNGAGGAGNGAQAAPNTANFGAAEREAFAAWCTKAEWALDVRSRLASADLGLLSADPHLARELVPLLEQLRAQDTAIDPRRAISGAGRASLPSLAESPPVAAQTDEGIARTTAAMDLIRGLERSVSSEAWAARRAVEQAAREAERRGWNALGSSLMGVSNGVRLDGSGALASLTGVIQAAEPSERLIAALRRFDAAARAAAEGAAGDERIARLPELLASVQGAGGADAAQAAGAAAARVEGLADLGESVATLVGRRWGQIDAAYFLAESAAADPAGSVDERTYQAWMQEIRREAYTRLPTDADPRRSWDVERRLTQMGESIGALAQAETPIEPADVERLQTELASLNRGLADLKAESWDRTHEARVRQGAASLDRRVTALQNGFDALTGQLQAQWERETARLAQRSQIEVGSDTLQEAWRTRRDELLARYTAPERLTALTDAAEALEDGLRRIDAAVPEVEVPRDRPGGVDVDALERALRGERERWVSRVLGALAWDGTRMDMAGLDASAAEATRDGRAWLDRVGEACHDMAAAERLLGGAYALDEAGPDGGTLLDLAESAGQDRVGADVAAVFGGLASRVQDQRRATMLRGTAELRALAGERDAPLGVSMAAWRTLEATGWPASPEQVQQEAALARGLVERAGALGEAARRDVLVERIRTGSAARWERAARAAMGGNDAAALGAVLDARHEFAVADAGLPAPLRFNLMLLDLRRSAQEASGADAQARTLLAEFLASADALGLDPSVMAPVGEWLGQARALVGDAPAEVVIDPTTLGPGAIGWRGEEVDGQRVRFTSPDGAATLEFVRLDVGDSGLGAAAYLCTTELSVGALQWATDREGRVSRLRELTAASPPESAVGIKTWVFVTRPTGDAIVPADGWYLAKDRRPGVEPLAPGLDAGTPSPGTPATWIPAAAAQEIAGWFGCRLPSAGEWRAGLARYEGGDEAPASWNLRDASWAPQLAHVRGSQRVSISAPDDGAFVPDESTAPTGASAEVFPNSDRSVFFEDVGVGHGRVLRHMVGNVSEFVTLAGGGESFGVIGASALSAPQDYRTLLAGAEVPGYTIEYGWADVGLRPCFSLDGAGGVAPLHRRIRQLAERAPLLMGVDVRGGGE